LVRIPKTIQFLENDLRKDFKLFTTINKRIIDNYLIIHVGLVKLEQSQALLALHWVHDKAWFLAELAYGSNVKVAAKLR